METAATTAEMTAHTDAVRAIYEAFGRGDIPAILERLAPDVRWEHWSDSFAQRAEVPMFMARLGHDGVAEFFNVVGACTISEFSVKDLLSSEGQVAAEVVIDATLPNGGRYRDEELHLWSFDSDGRVSRMRHYIDTAKHIAANRGEDTATP